MSTKDVEEFINRTKRTLEEKKTMPFEIKRAVFLSNVFTETSNQLKFKKVLQHVRNEQKNKENKLINDEENKYRIMKREHEENVSKNKFLTGRSLKNEYEFRFLFLYDFFSLNFFFFYEYVIR